MIAGARTAVAIALIAAPAWAGAPYDGRWAADPSACSSEGPLASPITVSSLAFSWPGAYCAVGTSYLVRDAWHVSARCWGEGSFTPSVPIRLQVRGDRLIFEWGRARPEELRRCP
jgi:hypothetical protein